uniref:Uncharacterized protein n=1 Tax=Mus musculus TaxID=10090 RepID=Q9DAI7_MOUSE|nr:unnamed protein product [Mus musculus]|eukprot:NP_083584.1 uncharacterized protein LOC75485 [Mus musculus]
MAQNHTDVELSAPSPEPCLPACHHVSRHDENGLNLQTKYRRRKRKPWKENAALPRLSIRNSAAVSTGFSRLLLLDAVSPGLMRLPFVCSLNLATPVVHDVCC